MRRWIQLLFCLAIVGLGAIAVAHGSATDWWGLAKPPQFRTAKVDRGQIVYTVNSTGTIKPVQSVLIGSFVSGPVSAILVDFNDQVTKGQLLAKIDPRIYEASVFRDQAILDTQLADVQRVQAQLQQAKNDELRSQRLRERNRDYISDTEMDQFRFSRMALEAQLTVAEAAVKQAEANLKNSKANLGYTEILSPVDGIVIDRKIDPGQTLASQFQTPELFTIAPDMDKVMHVFASVDEADIGMIRRAQETNQPVKFDVDAYPEDEFHGTIYQIRKSSTTTNNVVTYPVVIAAPNPDLKLLPGMTADIEFQIEVLDDVVRLPNAALLYYPPPELVRQQDRGLVDASMKNAPEARKKRRADQRHVWVAEGKLLRAVPVRVGLTDGQFTQLVSGDVQPGQSLVTALESDLRGG
ncbi:MAG: efflux RND transporter periplasmic adaptor subunit [Planctomycetes bacterium]|nr:efflux RND transporter periplasmic adaptor subunit [Planctomycetota bacterium]